MASRAALSEKRDWFYFVNGIEPDVGAAEIRLRPGDIAWWDYRSWGGRMEQPVVVGAFPEPFLHGWDGKRRPVEMRLPAGRGGESPRDCWAARRERESRTCSRSLSRTPKGRPGRAARAANGAPVTFRLAGSEAVRGAVEAPRRSGGRPLPYTARFDDNGELIG